MIDDHIKNVAKTTMTEKLDDRAQKNQVWGFHDSENVIKALLHRLFEHELDIHVSQEEFMKAISPPKNQEQNALSKLMMNYEVRNLEQTIVSKANE